jgi:hypothetical protein
LPDLLERPLRRAGVEEARRKEPVEHVVFRKGAVGRGRGEAFREGRRGRGRKLLRRRRRRADDLGEQRLRLQVLRDQAGKDRELRDHLGAAHGQRLLRLVQDDVLHVVVRHDHRGRSEQAVLGEVPQRREGEAVDRGELRPDVVDLLSKVGVRPLQILRLVLELLLQHRLDERAAAEQPDREREEDRHDRDDVVPKGDHSNPFSSNSHCRNCSKSWITYRRRGGDTTITAAIAAIAAPTRNSPSRVRIRDV